jgi:hypothetical protein
MPRKGSRRASSLISGRCDGMDGITSRRVYHETIVASSIPFSAIAHRISSRADEISAAEHHSDGNDNIEGSEPIGIITELETSIREMNIATQEIDRSNTTPKILRAPLDLHSSDITTLSEKLNPVWRACLPLESAILNAPPPLLSREEQRQAALRSNQELAERDNDYDVVAEEGYHRFKNKIRISH